MVQDHKIKSITEGIEKRAGINPKKMTAPPPPPKPMPTFKNSGGQNSNKKNNQ